MDIEMLINELQEQVFILEGDEEEIFIKYSLFIPEKTLFIFNNEIEINNKINFDMVYDLLSKLLLHYFNNTLLNLDTQILKEIFLTKYNVLVSETLVKCFYRIIINFFDNEFIKFLNLPFVLVKTINYEQNGLIILYKQLSEEEL